MKTDKKKSKRPLVLLILLLLFVVPSLIKLTLKETGRFSGTLEVTEHNVGARVPGRITVLLVDEGSKVTKGQLLAKLDRYEQAELDYQRAEKTFQTGGLSKQTLERARLDFEDQQVLSPLDGEVLMKIREQGEVVAAGSPIAVVADLSHLWVRLFVNEGFVNLIHLGSEAAVRFDGVESSYVGRVIYIAPQAEFTPRNVQTPEERVTETFAVKVELEKAPVNLRPGVPADVTFKS